MLHFQIFLFHQLTKSIQDPLKWQQKVVVPFPAEKSGIGSWRALPGESGGRTRPPFWAPPSCLSFPNQPSSVCTPTRIPGASKTTSGRHSPTRPPMGHCSLITFTVSPLCFCLFQSPSAALNYDKSVLSFISVSKPASRQPSHHKAARRIFP